jgi:threonylcarbamoyladenosine tRNA methylthiotransferase CDKAL1
MTKVFVQTHGCSANLVEAEAMMGLLNKAGFRIVDEMEYSDVNIINICTLKGTSAPLKEIRNFTKQYPEKSLIVTGCITKDIIPKIRSVNEAASLISTHNINRIVDAVEESLNGNVLEALAQERILKVELPKQRSNKTIGIVPISSGCADFCTYCSVKLIKGNIFSYPELHIVNEVKRNVEQGCKEIWITSQDNGAYGLDKGERRLHALLSTVLNEVPGNYRIRLGMINPRHVIEILDSLIQVYQDDRIFKFLHIPVESGNNEILGRMERKYNVHDYKQIVEKFRRYVPNITIASDIIVGFPSETELQFQDSLHLIQEVKFDVINVARFSPRPDTKAARMEEQVDPDIKRERSKEMTDLFQRVAMEKNRAWIGWEGAAIIDQKGMDGSFQGRNFAYKPIAIKGNFSLGDEIFVKVLYATSYDLRAKVIEKPMEVSVK